MKNRILGFLRQHWVNLIVFAIVFFAAFLLLASQWIKSHFETNDFGIILFHLRFPLLGNGAPLVASFMFKVIFASLLIAFCVSYTKIAIRFAQFAYNITANLISKISTSKITAFKVIFSIALFALCANIVVNRFHIKDYVRTQTQFSQLYEAHYKPFDSANLTGFTPKQNLIIIFVESLESNLANQIAQNGGGGGNATLNLIPNFQKIATDNINFSLIGGFGGIEQVSGTGGTINGIIGYMCGIPLNLPFAYFDTNKYFLSSATCISDILDALGYKQSFIAGTDFSFAGKRNFLQSHSVEVMDLKYFQNHKILPQKLPKEMQGVWSLKDSKMFDLAKDYLESLEDSKPFALYLLTVDTHGPQGFADKEQCPNLDNSYENAYLCTDKIVSDFVDYLQRSRFKDNTTIIILGDHLSMAHFIQTRSRRVVFNAFINAKWTKTPTHELTKGRVMSHFDITPLILDSLGLRVDSFGLGRNPLYQRTLLEREFTSANKSHDEFNTALKLRNKVYDNFWEVK